MWRCSQDVAVLLDNSVQYSLRAMDRDNGVLANWERMFWEEIVRGGHTYALGGLGACLRGKC